MEPRTPPYAVQFTGTAIENLRRYPRNDQRRIVARVETLAADPYAMRNVKKLVDFDVAYRLRVGNYRVLFEIDD